MPISANQAGRAAIGLQLLTAWADPDGSVLTQNSLSQIFEEDGTPGLIEATMGLQDVAALLLLMYREETGKAVHAILNDLAGKIQSR